MKKNLLFCLILFCVSYVLNAQTTFSTKQIINATTGTHPYTIDSGLLDGDAFNDIIIGTEGSTLEWYKNNGNGTFTMQTTLTHSLSTIYGVTIADLDGINGNDIIASGFSNDKLVWFPNNGDGTFGAEQTISSAIDGAGFIVTGLIDAGASLDVAVVAYYSGETVWFSNDGSGNFTGPNIIASVASSGPGDLDLADFDSDGDLDVVIANTDSGTVEVYDNILIPDGSVSFVKYSNTVDSGSTYLFKVEFADVDNDGSLDILKSNTGINSMNLGDLAWYKRDNNLTTTTFTETPIPSTLTRPAVITSANLDNDVNNYNDIIVTNASTVPDDIIWYESIGSPPTTLNTESAIDNTQKQVYGLTINDFDNDGDLDIASVNYQDNDLNWFENYKINPPLGLHENEINKIIMFPNPTKNQLNFKGISENIDVSVYDIVGKNVLNKTLEANETLDVSKLHSGIYILKFKDYNSTFKFIKE